ncbi:LPXTG cell wall anchor domain-containing protein [Aeromicrobium sp. CnD17-E]|uniref:LPXTG cell wall anchor domain-containing protein n=1 Tax=Aeromicrobium sp. CnD17-E TaxID=2954487 RepID=UPI00209723FC|nr:LPXTG cell wall anchor domain-containing protein [Aeromicrobium sp. CnD17-E]MCO7239136.1 MSCRAMM family adhesin SdrC [Aeromicrobium sp. CnD17-E]
MKKHLAALVASVVAAVGLVALPSATLAPAQGATVPYPVLVCDIQVSKTRVAPGETFTATVTADVPTTITATYEGQTRTASNTKKLVATFTAPQVTRSTSTTVRAICGDKAGSGAEVIVAPSGGSNGDGGSQGDADADGGSQGDADVSADGGSQGDADADGGSQGDADVNADGLGSQGDADVNAGGAGTDGVADADAGTEDRNGILPGTGGTDFWLLVLGALLVLAGVGAVVARRRRDG